MTSLSFLSSAGASPAAIFRSVIQSLVSGQFTFDVPGLTQPQVQKILTAAKFLAAQPAGDRPSLLESVGCPSAASVATVIDAYAEILVPKTAIHDLRDFDWSTSVVLGTSTISNIKVPLVTFRFDLNANEGGRPVVKSRTIELTVEEAQLLLNQLETARTAQRELLLK
jgi:hypothetical protein